MYEPLCEETRLFFVRTLRRVRTQDAVYTTYCLFESFKLGNLYGWCFSARVCPSWDRGPLRERHVLLHLLHGNAAPGSSTRDFLAVLFSFAAATRHLSNH